MSGKLRERDENDPNFISFVDAVVKGSVRKHITFDRWKVEQQNNVEWLELLKKINSCNYTEADWKRFIDHLSSDV